MAPDFIECLKASA